MSDPAAQAPAPDRSFSTRLPLVSASTQAELARSAALMAYLRGPDGCPWDREQSFDSIKRHTLEETYEVLDAIERRDWAALEEELGDLFLQVLFYSQMAAEAGHFSLEGVARTLNEKLIRRHPHLFGSGSGKARTAEEVNRAWEAVKTQEKDALGLASAPAYLDQVPQYVPALLEAQKLGSAAAKVGFDWPSPEGLFDKLAEESQELKAESEAHDHTPGANVEAITEELGDLLFTAVNLARHLKREPEFALRRANRKFRERFGRMETLAGGADALCAATPAELERLWQQVKQQLASYQARVATPASANQLLKSQLPVGPGSPVDSSALESK